MANKVFCQNNRKMPYKNPYFMRIIADNDHLPKN